MSHLELLLLLLVESYFWIRWISGYVVEDHLDAVKSRLNQQVTCNVLNCVKPASEFFNCLGQKTLHCVGDMRGCEGWASVLQRVLHLLV